MAVTQIDIGKLREWNATNTTLRSVLGRDLAVVYVADRRTAGAGTNTAVRVINGRSLPPMV